MERIEPKFFPSSETGSGAVSVNPAPEIAPPSQNAPVADHAPKIDAPTRAAPPAAAEPAAPPAQTAPLKAAPPPVPDAPHAPTPSTATGRVQAMVDALPNDIHPRAPLPGGAVPTATPPAGAASRFMLSRVTAAGRALLSSFSSPAGMAVMGASQPVMEGVAQAYGHLQQGEIGSAVKAMAAGVGKGFFQGGTVYAGARLGFMVGGGVGAIIGAGIGYMASSHLSESISQAVSDTAPAEQKPSATVKPFILPVTDPAAGAQPSAQNDQAAATPTDAKPAEPPAAPQPAHAAAPRAETPAARPAKPASPRGGSRRVTHAGGGKSGAEHGAAHGHGVGHSSARRVPHKPHRQNLRSLHAHEVAKQHTHHGDDHHHGGHARGHASSHHGKAVHGVRRAPGKERQPLSPPNNDAGGGWSFLPGLPFSM